LPFAFREHRFRLILDTPNVECYVELTEIGMNFAEFRLLDVQFRPVKPEELERAWSTLVSP
jgi:hypothetical protein